MPSHVGTVGERADEQFNHPKRDLRESAFFGEMIGQLLHAVSTAPGKHPNRRVGIDPGIESETSQTANPFSRVIIGKDNMGETKNTYQANVERIREAARDLRQISLMEEHVRKNPDSDDGLQAARKKHMDILQSELSQRLLRLLVN